MATDGLIDGFSFIILSSRIFNILFLSAGRARSSIEIFFFSSKLSVFFFMTPTFLVVFLRGF